MTSTRRVTLQDVANEAGVSIATASRVMSSLVASKAATERVHAAAANLGYIANEAARSLRSERTMTIGVAFFSLKLPGALEMLDSLARVLDEHGYTLLIAHTAGDASRFDVILRRFLERRVDGVLVANPAGVGPIVAQYQDGRIPAAALISRGDGATELPLFTADMDDASAEVVERLERLGHRKVASVLPSGGHRPFGPLVRRLRASPMEVATYPRGTTADELVDACTGTERATAVLATYPVSLSILAACRRRGVMVPGDLSVVAVGDEPALANVIEQSPSAISFDLGEVGRAAGEAMLAWLGGEAPARNTLVQASAWVERGTTGPPAGRRGRAYRGR